MTSHHKRYNKPRSLIVHFVMTHHHQRDNKWSRLIVSSWEVTSKVKSLHSKHLWKYDFSFNNELNRSGNDFFFSMAPGADHGLAAGGFPPKKLMSRTRITIFFSSPKLLNNCSGVKDRIVPQFVLSPLVRPESGCDDTIAHWVKLNLTFV